MRVRLLGDADFGASQGLGGLQNFCESPLRGPRRQKK